MVVDFPLPFGPRNPKTDPSGIVKDKLSTAFRDPNDFDKFMVFRIILSSFG
jgi:hypothetical protein